MSERSAVGSISLEITLAQALLIIGGMLLLAPTVHNLVVGAILFAFLELFFLLTVIPIAGIILDIILILMTFHSFDVSITANLPIEVAVILYIVLGVGMNGFVSLLLIAAIGS